MSANLTHIRDLLTHGQQLPPASALWLVRSIDRLIAGDEPRSVLGLDHAGGLRERNRILRAEAESMPGATWRKAREISKLARKHRAGMKVPDWISRANNAARIPSTTRQIYSIIS